MQWQRLYVLAYTHGHKPPLGAKAKPARPLSFATSPTAEATPTLTDRITRKQQYYQQLAISLRTRGWSVRTVQAATCAPPPPPDVAQPTPQPQPYDSVPMLSFGISGEIYASNLHALRTFGINKQQCKTLATRIHFTSIKWAAHILRTDTQSYRQTATRTPNACRSP
jgi:hypothetical protein